MKTNVLSRTALLCVMCLTGLWGCSRFVSTENTGTRPISAKETARIEAEMASTGCPGRLVEITPSIYELTQVAPNQYRLVETSAGEYVFVETDTDGDGVSDCRDACPGSDDSIDVNNNGVPDGCEGCLVDADCSDGVFCNGDESCVNGVCVSGSSPCVDTTCNEEMRRCDQCESNDDCSDGLFCTGVEACASGSCIPGTPPCIEGVCNEGLDRCDDCQYNEDCDDSLFCNGSEVCNNGECSAGTPPCDVSLCDEVNDRCNNPPTPPSGPLYSENFDSVPAGGDPLGWFDTRAGNSTIGDDSLFKVQSVSGNKVFRTSDSGINIHSHFTAAGSADWTNYEFSGRMRGTASDSGVGVTFFSEYPVRDVYYRLRAYDGGTFHIEPHGTLVTSGATDSGVSFAANKWFRFRVSVRDDGNETRIQGNVWADGTNEPRAFAIDCADNSGTRIKKGTFGVWSMRGGNKEWDDFEVSLEDCSVDTDGDGVPDCHDLCPGRPDIDTDGDGTLDCRDGCPNDPKKTSPMLCGCGVSEADSDGDGVPDCNDVCPGFDDNVDTDNDGTPDGCDHCVNDAECDDGLFCNGVETCSNGSCVMGPAPCSDGQACDESSDSCVSQSSWISPIGIPTPAFGVTQTVESIYGAGHFTHWVDSTHASATDSNNAFGTPSKPRKTIPTSLPAGSVVEVRGGPYNARTSGDYMLVSGNGTLQQPVFVRGPAVGTRPSVTRTVNFDGSYVIVENFNFVSAQGLFVDHGDHHIAVRNSEFTGGGGSGVMINSWDGSSSHDIVISNCSIHDWGDWHANFDQDFHGVEIGRKASNVWIVDCEMYHNSGDGVQINGGQGGWSTTHHIYLGRNEAWENKQTGFWAKQSSHVVMSQNKVHDVVPSASSADGAGMGGQYDPHPVWYIYNDVSKCDTGFAQMSGDGGGGDSYYIGNIVHDLRDSDGNFNPGSAWSDAAFLLVGTTNRYVIDNTVYNVPAGIHCPATYGSYTIANNVVSTVNHPSGKHVWVENYGAADNSSMSHCLLFQPSGNVSISWDRGSSSPGAYAGVVVGDPKFVSPSSGDFHLQSSSPARGGAAVSNVYATFQSLYGIDIRPAASPGDIGAY